MFQGHSQRSIYKLIDALLSTTYDDSKQMLEALVQYLVDSSDLIITGGRIWELNAHNDTYQLQFQYGELEDLELGAARSFSEMPGTLQLANHDTLQTNPIVIDGHGERTFSLCGIGEREDRSGSHVPKFALAFTALEKNDLFIDTMLVVSSAATTALRNMSSAQKSKALQRDLDHAWRIQRDLVPDHRRAYKNYDLYGVSVPASVVGGDYFDYLSFSEGDDRLAVVVSDAASKGLPAAVQALFVSGALRMGVTFGAKMSSLVSRLNQLIYDTFPNERFVSMFYAELMDSKTGLVLYVNAGHCPPLHFHASSGTVTTLQPTGGILGIIKDQPFTVENVNIEPGDKLVLFTDGITEAQDVDGNLYGEQRLTDLIQAHSTVSSEALTQIILDDVTRYAVGSTYTDDMTVLAISAT